MQLMISIANFIYYYPIIVNYHLLIYLVILHVMYYLA